MKIVPQCSVYALVGIAMAEKSFSEKNEKRLDSLELIAEDVCQALGISLDRLKGRKRAAELVVARKIYAHVARLHTGFSYLKIGEYIDRDHTTVVYYEQEVSGYLEIGDASFLHFWRMYQRNTQLPDILQSTDS